MIDIKSADSRVFLVNTGIRRNREQPHTPGPPGAESRDERFSVWSPGWQQHHVTTRWQSRFSEPHPNSVTRTLGVGLSKLHVTSGWGSTAVGTSGQPGGPMPFAARRGSAPVRGPYAPSVPTSAGESISGLCLFSFFSLLELNFVIDFVPNDAP